VKALTGLARTYRSVGWLLEKNPGLQGLFTTGGACQSHRQEQREDNRET